jgi:deoxyribonucleoside regulator
MMSEQRKERVDLLSNVAELYYLEGKTQAQIAKRVGVTRSMVSRMLNEARSLGIVDIRIHRSLMFNRELQAAFMERYPLADVSIVDVQPGNHEDLLKHLGLAGAVSLQKFLKPGMVLGIPWGTTVASVVDELEITNGAIPIKIVQLVGALGSQNLRFDSHSIVQQLAQKIGGEAYYMNAPFLVESEMINQALLGSSPIKDTFRMAQRCDVALLGIGSTDLQHSSYYQSGYLSAEEVQELSNIGVVGGICGVHFDIQGQIKAQFFQKRIVSISEETLRSIPLRICVAGGKGKAAPLLGAIRGGFINILVTDCWTALDLIERDPTF